MKDIFTQALKTGHDNLITEYSNCGCKNCLRKLNQLNSMFEDKPTTNNLQTKINDEQRKPGVFLCHACQRMFTNDICPYCGSEPTHYLPVS